MSRENNGEREQEDKPNNKIGPTKPNLSPMKMKGRPKTFFMFCPLYVRTGTRILSLHASPTSRRYHIKLNMPFLMQGSIPPSILHPNLKTFYVVKTRPNHLWKSAKAFISTNARVPLNLSTLRLFKPDRNKLFQGLIGWNCSR